MIRGARIQTGSRPVRPTVAGLFTRVPQASVAASPRADDHRPPRPAARARHGPRRPAARPVRRIGAVPGG